ncbi:undecaprenyl-diphosphate phosphatase [Thermococcus argininiproducens]|uniref:Undecaprenyl-diphosphatase n=1 Tax=Thermococcus argininiproducens TaxID=2866384 RepID=A0A9E7SDM1_9EURY|nr:undecaprenyl-diphosphate phosphatase [Thermococcus argininiproducens]USH00986.1 undecaprenyl-diphosphate phosphatase [Thermococcus argininiproducens]
MEYYQAVFIGILQGITEWLPISSSGQVMLSLINFIRISPEDAYSYSLILHLGTLMALLFKFRYDLGKIMFKLLLFRWEEEEKFLFYSTLFTGLIGLPLYKGFKSIVSSFNPEAVNGIIGIALILTGIMLKKSQEAPLERLEKGLKKEKDEVTIVDAIIAGIAQGVAVIPGISRSGMTIGSLLLLGIKQEKAVRLSFLMAAPAIIGALFLELPEASRTSEPLSLPLASILSAFIVSLLMLELMMKLAKRLNFSRFCIFFGFIALIASLVGVLT